MTNDVEEGRVHDQVYCSHYWIEIIKLFWGPGSKLHVLENVACSLAVPELLQGLFVPPGIRGELPDSPDPEDAIGCSH